MITKSERHDQEHTIFQTRNDAGTQAMRAWLYARRDEVNSKWTGMIGEDLMRLQGEASLVNRLIKMIDFGPTVPKQPEEKNHG